MGAATPTPLPSPLASPAPYIPGGLSASELLFLPAYDLDGLAGKEQLRVGDALPLASEKASAARLVLDIPKPNENAEQTDSLEQQGWGIILPQDPSQTPQAVTLKAGKLTLPTFLLKDSEGKTVGRTLPITFTVESAIQPDDPKPKEPIPALPPAHLVFPWLWLVLFGLVGLLLLALVIFSLFRWHRSRKPKQKRAPPQIHRTEDDIALRALLDLEKKDYLKSARFKPHYFGISEILKAYLGDRYEFDSRESTTQELLNALRNGDYLPEPERALIKELYTKLDLVKFTDHIPDSTEGRDLLAEARKLVARTRRPPQISANRKEQNHAV